MKEPLLRKLLMRLVHIAARSMRIIFSRAVNIYSGVLFKLPYVLLFKKSSRFFVLNLNCTPLFAEYEFLL